MPDSGAGSQAQHHRDDGNQKANLEETRARQWRSFPKCLAHRARTPNEIPAPLERQLEEEGSRRLDCTIHVPSIRTRACNLLFKKKNLCGTQFRAFVFERSITTASQPIQRLETACDVTFLALPSDIR